jgi:hypothetical protein
MSDGSNNLYKYVIMLICVLVAPVIYSLVQGYWALNLVPVLKLFNANDQLSITITIIAMNLVGAFMASILVSLPYAYIIGRNAVRNGILLALLPLLMVLWVYSISYPETKVIITLGECVSIIIAFVMSAILGEKLKNRHRNAT